MQALKGLVPAWQSDRQPRVAHRRYAIECERFFVERLFVSCFVFLRFFLNYFIY